MFDSRLRKVNFNELLLRIQILCVKPSEDRYYLELDRENRMLKKRKRKKTVCIRK